MLKRVLFIFTNLLILTLIFVGCSNLNQAKSDIRDYFPLTQGSYWQYKGEGNEYASFKREVIYQAGDKLQIKEDNGGTVTQSVWQITNETLTRVFFQGEEYDSKNYLNSKPNDNTVILQSPLIVGTKWEDPHGVREIVDTNAIVNTPVGDFKDCLKVKITSDNSTVYEYFAKGVGMVKREFMAGDATITSTLEKYNIK